MRRRACIMDDWVFTKEGKSIQVKLPHTWNNMDGQDGGNDYYRSTCTYEKRLKAPEYDSQKEAVFLEFEGVNASARVVLNGKEVAKHDGGYSTFRCDVTSALQAENDLCIQVDNSVNTRVYPQKADFTFYGGIYRDVNWLIVDKSHFELLEWGTPGLYVTPVVKSEDLAQVQVKALVDMMPEERDCSVSISILDSEGKLLATTSTDVTAGANQIEQEFSVEKPHLWNGVKAPYLYTAVCGLYRGTERIDEIACDFGIRTIAFDKNKGFFLNGKPYPMRGVSRHQDRKDLGNAISYEMMEEDMALIKELGANCIRLAHYQHSQHFYDLCDREGMLVWAEIPYISAYMKEGDQNTHDQMVELITQNYNHPSIVTWGISNEITIDNKNSRGDNLKNHERLNALIHGMDPSRPTSIACYALCTPFHPVTRIPDLIAWNLYLGWYVPGLFLNDAFMWFYHTFYKLPLGYSEYGAEGMPNLHSAKPRRGDHTEEYQAKYHEYMLKCFDRHPYLWSTFVWNMFDFAADARNQGGEPGMNHKGLVTFDRKIKKDSFYLYKAWWSEDPFVHITSKRFVYRNKRNIDVKVYSNQSSVALYVDDKLYTTIEADKIFEFKNVPISESTRLRVEANGVEDRTEFKFTNEIHKEYILQKDKSKNAANWV